MKPILLPLAAALLIWLPCTGSARAAGDERPRAGTFQVVMEPGGSWWNLGLGAPCVLLEDGVYKMWFTGEGADPWVYGQIGYATSTDGVHFGDQQMVLDRPGWHHNTFAPCVLKEGSQYVMWLTQYWTWSAGEWAHYVTRALSDDGVHWYGEQPVLTGTTAATSCTNTAPCSGPIVSSWRRP